MTECEVVSDHSHCPICSSTVPLDDPQGLCDQHKYDEGPQAPNPHRSQP